MYSFQLIFYSCNICPLIVYHFTNFKFVSIYKYSKLINSNVNSLI